MALNAYGTPSENAVRGPTFLGYGLAPGWHKSKNPKLHKFGLERFYCIAVTFQNNFMGVLVSDYNNYVKRISASSYLIG